MLDNETYYKMTKDELKNEGKAHSNEQYRLRWKDNFFHDDRLAQWRRDEGILQWMKKIANILLCGVGLNVIEYIIVLLCAHADDVIRYSVPVTRIGGALRDAGELFPIRLLFYFVSWVIPAPPIRLILLQLSPIKWNWKPNRQ